VHEHESAAADRCAEGLDDTGDERGANRGVDGRAAFAQAVHACIRFTSAACGDGAVAYDDLFAHDDLPAAHGISSIVGGGTRPGRRFESGRQEHAGLPRLQFG
jgi:hypothetical protein